MEEKTKPIDVGNGDGNSFIRKNLLGLAAAAAA